jgi:hypothetical protein
LSWRRLRPSPVRVVPDAVAVANAGDEAGFSKDRGVLGDRAERDVQPRRETAGGGSGASAMAARIATRRR